MTQAKLLVIVPFWIVTSPFVRKNGVLLPTDKVFPFRSMVMFALIVLVTKFLRSLSRITFSPSFAAAIAS